jgi:tetratricopeptide (TPR) repeat protein
MSGQCSATRRRRSAARQFSRAVGGSGPTSRAESGELSPIELARVYESQGNYAKAEAAYRELLNKNPNDPEVVRHLADVLFREDKIEESANVLKRLTAGN